jgi:hypothetical protein
MARAKWPRICGQCGGLNAASFTACVHCARELPNRRFSDSRYNNRKRAERRNAARAERAAKSAPVFVVIAVLRSCAAATD